MYLGGIGPHMRTYWTILAALFLAMGQLQATHIIGGEIYYDRQNGNNYQVTLDLYRDCSPANTNNTGFDASVQIRVFTANGAEFAIQTIPFSGETIVPVVIPNPCLVAPPNVCVATARYQAVFNLPPSPGGYTITYQRCCRVPSIVNLFQPGAQGLTCTVRVPGQPLHANSSPRFDEYPPIIICAGEELVFDHSASDPDADSLAYVLCTPLQGGSSAAPAPVPAPPPYTPVPWAAGYSETFQLNSTPPMAIDPVTGVLTAFPTQQGRFTVGVCVQEYRNGVLIGQASRDFMFTVVVCDANIDAVVSAQPAGASCNGLTQTFGNASVNGQTWWWDFGDPNSTADTSSLANPTWTYSAPGIYTVTLIANPGWPCADTSTAQYAAFLPLDPVVTAPPFGCGPVEQTLSVAGNFGPAAVIDWGLPAGVTQVSGGGSSITVAVPTDGPQTVNVTVAENGCSGSATAQVGSFPFPVPEIPAQDAFCTGLTVAFSNNSQGALSYRWDFGDPGTLADTSNLAIPTWTYAQQGTYLVTLQATGQGACSASTTATFEVYTDIAVSFVEPPIRCPGQPAELLAEGPFTPAAEVQWDFGALGDPSSATGPNAVVRFNEVGTYPVTLVVSENGCSGSFTGQVVVHPFPVADLTSETRACVGASFAFQDLSTAFTPLSYAWQFGDGETSTDADPVHRYAAPGLYTVTLTVSTNEGCIASSTVVRPAQVEVFPNPVAAFSALPREVSVFDPRITIEDLSLDAITWTYTVEGNTYEVPALDYFFEEGGQYLITLLVTSPNGCSDTTSRRVFVSDHIFWAPSAFTPDGDGTNDLWAPVVIGARTYELEIFDRWGVLRFRTDDPRSAWDGEGLPASVFTYRARIKEWGAESKEYVGHFTLVR